MWQELNDPYGQLRNRMREAVQKAGIEDQIFTLVQGAFEQTLRAESIVLSQSERRRLLRDVLKDVLTGMLAEIDGPQQRPQQRPRQRPPAPPTI